MKELEISSLGNLNFPSKFPKALDAYVINIIACQLLEQKGIKTESAF